MAATFQESGSGRADTKCADTLVVGWRAGTTQALEALGRTVTCVLAPADVPTARRSGFAGEVIVVPDPANVEHVLSGLERAGVPATHFSVVGTNLEPAIVAASVLGSMVGARCLAPRTAVLLRDKVAQKATVRSAGLAAARCFTVDTLSDLPGEESAYPLVVKPLAGAGTVDTHALSTPQAARELALGRPGKQGHGPWAVEEFIDGAEMQIDGVVREGEVIFLVVSRYLQNLIEIRHGGLVGTVLLDRQIHRDTYARVDDVVSRSLRSLGHTDGVFHLEAFSRRDQVIFSECAGRTTGGMVREKLIHKFGVDLVSEWARALVGLPARIPNGPRDSMCYGSANFVAPIGEIVVIPDVAEVLAQPGVVEATVEIKAGDTAADPRTSSNVKAGRFVVAAETENEVEKLLNATAQWFAASTVVR
ncbi:ATP-grasp domain-containing protein [Streptomyces sp. NPDC053728]|uniref:ATP-grasp domain-containing protein n=1 Tax=Streptomyces sp. NPDC053728 TaxID=3155534 RepID=UPI0034306E58